MRAASPPRRIRPAASALFAVAAVLLALVGPVAAQDAGPATPPAVPAATVGELVGGPGGEVTAAQERSVASLTVGADHAWVYLYVYPVGSTAAPVGVGWLEPDDGVVRVDLVLMPRGENVIAVVDRDGELVGWARTTLGADDSDARPSTGTSEVAGGSEGTGAQGSPGTGAEEAGSEGRSVGAVGSEGATSDGTGPGPGAEGAGSAAGSRGSGADGSGGAEDVGSRRSGDAAPVVLAVAVVIAVLVLAAALLVRRARSGRAPDLRGSTDPAGPVREAESEAPLDDATPAAVREAVRP